MEQKFPAKHKLKQKSDIDVLFAKGRWKTLGRVRMIVYSGEEINLLKIGVSAPKKNFKKAVDRNRIKRLLRESYRLNKQEIVSCLGANSLVMFFWISKDLPNNFAEVQQEILALCQSFRQN